jgi:hypothetical protein
MRTARVMTRFLASVALGVFVLAAASAPRHEAAGTVAAGDSLDDGPHVYWADSAHAVVLYVCHGALKIERYQVVDTLRFRGLCADSLDEYRLAARPPKIEPEVLSRVPRILTVSDVHGDYDELVAFLRQAGVVDRRLRWTWGNGHLVVDGDVFDRGDGVTQSLWLIRRLEDEARASGGRVHYLLGNHELMAFRGDTRYVNAKYLNGIARLSRISYQDLFGPDMELGRWLRTKHVAIRLNDILFVHGGLSPAMAAHGLSLSDLNAAVRGMIDLKSYELELGDHPAFLLGTGGPLWYRGYHYAMEGAYPQITTPQLDSVLAFYGARVVVVGHTELPAVRRLYEGRAWGIDVPVDALGGFEGLLWEQGAFTVITVDGGRRS